VHLALVAPLAACLQSPPGRGEPTCGVSDEIVAIGLGRDHGCARLENGGVWCWGLNDQGQLGDGSAIDRSTPSQVNGLSEVVELAVGQDHSCAVKGDGTLWCWGSGSNGQLGNGGEEDSLVPVQADMVDVAHAALGDDFTCAVDRDGAVLCWGENEHGQAGAGFPENATEPVPIQLPAAALSLAVGKNHACARLESKQVACWGGDDVGQLGDGMLADRGTSEVIAGLDGVEQLVSGRDHACAITGDGALRCWGSTERGQLATLEDNADDGCTSGLGVPLSCVPIEIDLGADVIASAAGLEHTCAVIESGEVRCFGGNDSGQLGNGTFDDSAEPVDVRIDGKVVSLVAGENQNCATTDAGASFCWGSNRADQLAQSAALIGPSPVIVEGAEAATEISAGDYFTCIVQEDAVYCWGANDAAQLGDRTGQARSLPTHAIGVLGPINQLALGEEHSCYLSTTSQARCWGRNDHAELGPGADDEIEPIALNVTGLGGAIGQMDAGDEHSCAVRRDDGVLLCWGSDDAGQLGDGDIESTGPVEVDLPDVVEVATGDSHTCSRQSAGEVHCWGENGSGQLGDTSTSDTTAPSVQLPLNADRIECGDDFTCAISGQMVFCWGANDFGQLGNGSQETSLAPQSIASLPPAIDISLGAEHACAIVMAGSGQPQLMCWGRNDGGQLGDGTTESSATPVPVELPGAPLEVAAGDRHTCARVSYGADLDVQVLCWGSDVDGALGSGRDLYYNTPVGPISVCR